MVSAHGGKWSRHAPWMTRSVSTLARDPGFNDESAVLPEEALRRLREGNQRFVQNLRSVDVRLGQVARANLAFGQRPFAVVLSCSDSRVPSEIVFDQGLGDLFVIRVAGNIVAPMLVGSVELAALAFGTELVVVMGHSCCGAITATLDLIEKGTPAPTENIDQIVQRIRPSIEGLVRAPMDRDALVGAAVRANVRASVEHLRHASRLLEDRIAQGTFLVVGAEYALDTGRVDFFDGLPA